MRNLLLLAVSTATLSTTAIAAPLAEKVFAAWYGEIEYLDTVCQNVEVGERSRLELLQEAGVAPSDLEPGGALFAPYLTAKTNASDRFFGLSISDQCYYLTSSLGNEGYLATGVAVSE